MKYIITEAQYSKFLKSGESTELAIIHYMENLLKGATKRVKPKARNYGNLRETWCKDGMELLSVHYYFGEPNDEDEIKNKDFYNGQIYISEKVVETMMKLFGLRQKYILHVITEWYDHNYAPKFAQEMNEPYLHIDDAEVLDKEHRCLEEPKVDENLSDDEKIDFIVKKTLFTRQEVLDRINNGEENLDELYLQILEIQQEREQLGF